MKDTVSLVMLYLAASLCLPAVGGDVLKHAFAVGASLKRAMLVVCEKVKEAQTTFTDVRLRQRYDYYR